MTGLTLSAMVAEHKAQLGPAGDKFTAAEDGDFIRHVEIGVRNYGARWPLYASGSVTLAADQRIYDAPIDMLDLRDVLWGRAARRAYAPWEQGFPQRIPWGTVDRRGDTPRLVLDCAPTVMDIATWGATFEFDYNALPVLSATASESTVFPAHKDRVLLAAQIAAVSELMAQGIVAPIQLHKGLAPMPKETTPLAILKALQDAWARLP